MCPKVGVLTSVDERRGPDYTVGETRHGHVRERAGVPRPVGTRANVGKGTRYLQASGHRGQCRQRDLNRSGSRPVAGTAAAY